MAQLAPCHRVGVDALAVARKDRRVKGRELDQRYRSLVCVSSSARQKPVGA
jgi:hypothetical protein